MFIILNKTQSTTVSGSSLVSPYAVLSPIALTDGTYALNDTVLVDPNHEQHRVLLSSLPTKSLEEIQALLPTIPD